MAQRKNQLSYNMLKTVETPKLGVSFIYFTIVIVLSRVIFLTFE